MKFLLVMIISILSTNLAFAESESHEYENLTLMKALEENYTQVSEFLKASKEAERIQEVEGKSCRVVCFPCCYAPSGCTLVCD